MNSCSLCRWILKYGRRSRIFAKSRNPISSGTFVWAPARYTFLPDTVMKVPLQPAKWLFETKFILYCVLLTNWWIKSERGNLLWSPKQLKDDRTIFMFAATLLLRCFSSCFTCTCFGVSFYHGCTVDYNYAATELVFLCDVELLSNLQITSRHSWYTRSCSV